MYLKNIIIENQHSFVSGSSPGTDLIICTNFVAKALNNGYEVHLVSYTNEYFMIDLIGFL